MNEIMECPLCHVQMIKVEVPALVRKEKVIIFECELCETKGQYLEKKC